MGSLGNAVRGRQTNTKTELPVKKGTRFSRETNNIKSSNAASSKDLRRGGIVGERGEGRGSGGFEQHLLNYSLQISLLTVWPHLLRCLGHLSP